MNENLLTVAVDADADASAIDADADADASAVLTNAARSNEGDIRPLGSVVDWPPKDPEVWDANALRVPLTKFPRHAWDPWRYGFVVIDEFAGTDWKNVIPIKRPTDKQLDEHINLILRMTQTSSLQRSGMMAEIIAQRSQATRYWQAMLMFNARSHPWTFALMQISHHVARFVAMYYKAKFNVPRPSQRSPAILPWIDPPPHASFPSGHALEGMLISLVLGKAVPEAEKPLISLAERVGRNRERAGLHYKLDTDAGFNVAEHVLPLLLEKCPTYKEVFDAAKKEWDDLR